MRKLTIHSIMIMAAALILAGSASTALAEEAIILSNLKSKWSALADELVKPSYETELTEKIQEEISMLDSRLAETRLEHLFETDQNSTIYLIPETAVQHYGASGTI